MFWKGKGPMILFVVRFPVSELRDLVRLDCFSLFFRKQTFRVRLIIMALFSASIDVNDSGNSWKYILVLIAFDGLNIWGISLSFQFLLYYFERGAKVFQYGRKNSR